MFHYGGTMGDEDECGLHVEALVVLDEVGQQRLLGGLVEGAGGFVEEQDGASSQQRSGNGDALCLAF